MEFSEATGYSLSRFMSKNVVGRSFPNQKTTCLGSVLKRCGAYDDVQDQCSSALAYVGYVSNSPILVSKPTSSTEFSKSRSSSDTRSHITIKNWSFFSDNKKSIRRCSRSPMPLAVSSSSSFFCFAFNPSVAETEKSCGGDSPKISCNRFDTNVRTVSRSFAGTVSCLFSTTKIRRSSADAYLKKRSSSSERGVPAQKSIQLGNWFADEDRRIED
jgi:hypothetical protein